MGSGEKKVVAVLAVVLIALLGVYFGMPPKSNAPAVQMASSDTGGAPPAGPGGPGGAGPGGGGRMQQMQQQQGGQQAGGPGCSTPSGGGAEGVATFETGPKTAKIQIIAILPITHGCHVATEGVVKKIAKDHPQDVHLIVADLFGKDGPKYLKETKLSQSAAVVINGKTSFSVGGKQVTLLQQEGQMYQPSDIEPIVNDLLKGAKS